ncbi:NADH-ubiquinone oxidoreductase complex I, 21 kDa subunit-domain-containing protein [Collybia nuda]|uniref:NADH-ubiquinone oxidoreductase complex I, 21 kDa subunit-domain-containing protein n=1 Tax=Collybia nuda TaxID=64659 RepID=A0A9P6CJJ1_9AGAR|nr:NADH-ubiquinone oxidoreductase complex I, 21 kDa subunit-domain-containing protein [Collybia nuda]
MPQKVVEAPYPLIDADPHAFRVIRYMRPSDYATWAAATAAFPSALYLWEMADPSKYKMRTSLRLGGFLGFVGGFLLAYQRSSVRFWGWSENKREEDMDLAELSQRAQQGKPLYGESPQPQWVQGTAFRNSAFSQLKFSAFPMFNLVNHSHHGTDPAKYSSGSSNTTENI